MRQYNPLLILLALTILLATHVGLLGFFSDDGFIALRYARNLARGLGFVYNPGERVEGCTSLLWPLVLAPFYHLPYDFLITAKVLGLLFAALSLVAAWNLACTIAGKTALHHQPSLWTFFAPLLLCFHGAFCVWAAAGLETSLFVLLNLLAVNSALKQQRQGTFWYAMLLILCRPEGALTALACGLVLKREGKRGLSYLLGIALILTALTTFRLIYFGFPLPNTFYAKASDPGWELWTRGLSYVRNYLFDFGGTVIFGLSCLLILVWLRGGAAFCFLLGAAYFLATIWVGGDGLPMYRFMLWGAPLVYVAQGELFRRLSAQGQLAVNAALIGATAYLCVCAFSPPVAGRLQYLNFLFQRDVEIPRWSAAGLWLKQNAASDASVALVPIGAVGFYSDLKIYDMLGLTDPHIAQLKLPPSSSGWSGHEKHDGQYILLQRPSYLLLNNVDVTPLPRTIGTEQFSSEAVKAREADLFSGSALVDQYVARSVTLPNGEFLNFFELR
ncbi:MAG: hypothetical protein K1X83_08705 [Oligoflexia bacterium]|nr:hypothetical protein [Oligoflexia bacterium]